MFDKFRNAVVNGGATTGKKKMGKLPHSTPFARDVLKGGGDGSHHGVPSDITVATYEATSGIFAIGTSRGAIKVFGASGIGM